MTHTFISRCRRRSLRGAPSVPIPTMGQGYLPVHLEVRIQYRSQEATKDRDMGLRNPEPPRGSHAMSRAAVRKAGGCVGERGLRMFGGPAPACLSRC